MTAIPAASPPRGSMSRLLQELDDEVRVRAQRALARCPVVEVPAAARAELPEAALLVVEDGVVLLASIGGRGVVIAVAGPGDVLVPPAGDEEVRGLTPARLTAVTDRAERVLLGECGMAAAVTGALADAVRDRQQSLANLGRFPHVERVRGKLLQLARSHGRVAAGGVVVDLPLTHELIADLIGSTRETVTLSLRELMRSRFVARAGQRYRLSVRPEDLL